jgi:hypothetical protein
MKQETLEEAAKDYYETHEDVSDTLGRYLVSAVFQDGAKWQQERSYSEEDLKEAFAMGRLNKSIKDFNQRFKNK